MAAPGQAACLGEGDVKDGGQDLRYGVGAASPAGGDPGGADAEVEAAGDSAPGAVQAQELGGDVVMLPAAADGDAGVGQEGVEVDGVPSSGTAGSTRYPTPVVP